MCLVVDQVDTRNVLKINVYAFFCLYIEKTFRGVFLDITCYVISKNSIYEVLINGKSLICSSLKQPLLQWQKLDANADVLSERPAVSDPIKNPLIS